jgi:Na+/H+ antiporter NhaC
VSPGTKVISGRRLRFATLILGALLVGLWGLEQSTGPDVQRSRRQLAAEGLVRDGLGRLSAPHRDARGRPRHRVVVVLDASGDAQCLKTLRAALASHRVFRLGGVTARQGHRLRARCTLRQPPASRSSSAAELKLVLSLDEAQITRRASYDGRQRITGYLALIPPVVAVVAALATRRILLSMLLAIFCGALVMLAGSPSRLSEPLTTRLLWLPVDVLHALWWATRHFVGGPLLAQFKLQVMVFATSLVGMIAVITRAGGTQGLLSLVGRLRGRPHLARLSVWLMGLVLFFDDCANTLVVGSAARPITDAARVSREKLAYLVDSTAAPIAGVALISTWIGFEVGLFQTTADSLGLGVSGFEIFWQALPMRFYCLLTLGFVLASILLRRDFGPMLRAERRAARTGQVRSQTDAGGEHSEAFLEHGGPPDGLDPAWTVAVVPIGTVLVGVLGGILALGHQTPGVQLALSEGLYSLGTASHLRDCFTQAAKEGLQGWAMLVSGLAGSAVALLLARRRRRTLPTGSQALSWRELGWTYVSGARAIGGAIGILICAWGIQAACDALGSSVTLTAALAGNVDPTLLPLLIFATSAAIAFATGTSWGTMGILIPTVLPLAYALGGRDHPVLLYLAAGAVLDGAIFGDHCSPISDTTVMSSLSSGCNLMDHIRTQLPYAVSVMLAAAGFGYLGHAWGLPLWASYGLSMATLMGVLWVLGKNPDAP